MFQDSDLDAIVDYFGFPDGPAVPIVIESRLLSNGTCLVTGSIPASVVPVFLLDLKQFPTPWKISE